MGKDYFLADKEFNDLSIIWNVKVNQYFDDQDQNEWILYLMPNSKEEELIENIHEEINTENKKEFNEKEELLNEFIAD